MHPVLIQTNKQMTFFMIILFVTRWLYTVSTCPMFNVLGGIGGVNIFKICIFGELLGVILGVENWWL